MVRGISGCVLVLAIFCVTVGNRGVAELSKDCVANECIHVQIYREVKANETTFITLQLNEIDCRPCLGSTSRCRGPGGDPNTCKDTTTPQKIRYVNAEPKQLFCDLPPFPKAGKAEAGLKAGDYKEESYDPFGFVKRCPAKGGS